MSRIRDLLQIVRIAGPLGFRRLLRHSRNLKETTGRFLVQHALFALDRVGLTDSLLSDGGLDVSSQSELESSMLLAVCEYLYENRLLARLSPTRFKARNRNEFRALLRCMYASFAYGQPLGALDKLLTGQWKYGRDVVRDGKYDAIASADLTSLFSYGFSASVLLTTGARNVLDLGCGTGRFLDYLRDHGFSGALYGLDLSEEAIDERVRHRAKARGVELRVGDLFDVAGYRSVLRDSKLDVLSLMFVLHEFEDDAVMAMLRRIGLEYPAARVLLTELPARSSDEIRNARRTVFPELKFVHGISGQILRTRDQWRDLFERSGFTVRVERANKLTNQLCMFFASIGST